MKGRSAARVRLPAHTKLASVSENALDSLLVRVGRLENLRDTSDRMPPRPPSRDDPPMNYAGPSPERTHLQGVVMEIERAYHRVAGLTDHLGEAMDRLGIVPEPMDQPIGDVAEGLGAFGAMGGMIQRLHQRLDRLQRQVAAIGDQAGMDRVTAGKGITVAESSKR